MVVGRTPEGHGRGHGNFLPLGILAWSRETRTERGVWALRQGGELAKYKRNAEIRRTRNVVKIRHEAFVLGLREGRASHVSTARVGREGDQT